MVEEAGTANLEKVDHIVVLMLENRSFDHMLGYLSLEGGRSDVDGLREGLANEHQGRRYPVHHLGTTVIAEDPDHSASSVDLQIGGGKMDGFVASYAATMESRGVENGDPAPIMGYYHAADVPVYDHLASEFAACDRWFSSVPGATWPNRLYALCGRAAGSRDCHPHNLPPLYNQPSFVRHLDEHGVSWRWYSSDVGTLRMADQLYCLGHHDRFAYFTKTGLPWKAKLNLRVQSEDAGFLEDAARGTLPSVSWIDPNWGNFNPFGFEQNDDHPPADINDGQDLVLAVYHAVATSPQWDKTLLVIFYDEHGGFFDHVPPPEADDDDPRDVWPLRRACTGDDRVAVGRASFGVTHALRSHIDHQDDPAALLRRRPQTPRSPGAPVHLAQNRPSALHGNTRRARQQPGRTSDTPRATPRASPPRADSRRRGPGGRQARAPPPVNMNPIPSRRQTGKSTSPLRLTC